MTPPLREGVTAAVVTLAAAVLAFWTLPPADAVAATLLAGLVAAAAASDVIAYRLPDPVNAAILLLGLAFTAFDAPPGGLGDALLLALIRVVVVALLLLAVRTGHRWLRGRTGLGLGDVKLAAAGAAWLSFDHLAWAMLVACLAALAATAAQHLSRRGSEAAIETLVPFGAFLGPAIWAVWYGSRLLPPF